jgi:hypothetical protein
MIGLFAREAAAEDLSRMQLPWENAAARTAIVGHMKIEQFEPGEDGLAVPASFVDVPAGYVSTLSEVWIGVDEEGKYTQYMSRSLDPAGQITSEAFLTRDGEYLKSTRFVRGREERATTANEMTLDPEWIREGSRANIAEPGWEEEGTAIMGEVHVRSRVRSLDWEPINPSTRAARYERKIVEVGTDRLIRHDFLYEDGTLARAMRVLVDEYFEDPNEVPPDVWQPAL